MIGLATTIIGGLIVVWIQYQVFERRVSADARLPLPSPVQPTIVSVPQPLVVTTPQEVKCINCGAQNRADAQTAQM